MTKKDKEKMKEIIKEMKRLRFTRSEPHHEDYDGTDEHAYITAVGIWASKIEGDSYNHWVDQAIEKLEREFNV